MKSKSNPIPITTQHPLLQRRPSSHSLPAVLSLCQSLCSDTSMTVTDTCPIPSKSPHRESHIIYWVAPREYKKTQLRGEIVNRSLLSALLSQHPIYIPLPDVASFLGVKPEALRASIDQGRCPFGFSWKLGERSGYKIPTATFVAWFLKGVSPESLSI